MLFRELEHVFHRFPVLSGNGMYLGEPFFHEIAQIGFKGKAACLNLRGQLIGNRDGDLHNQSVAKWEPEYHFQKFSYFLLSPPPSCGIVVPVLRLISPLSAYVSSFARVSVMSRFRIVSCPMRSRGEKIESVFSIESRSG